MFSEISGYSNDGSTGHPFTSVSRSATLNMSLLGYDAVSAALSDTPSTWAAEQVNAAITAGIVPASL